MSVLGRFLVIFLAGVLGALVGSVAAARATPSFMTKVPYPHVVPQTEDGVALRFSMVHDVLHERFPRHGKAYYLERNRRTNAKIDAERAAKGTAANVSPLIDDLAVGFEFAGDHDGAIRLLRAKLDDQRAGGADKSELYSTYANLGTFLILGPFRQVRPGNEEDKATLREGLGMIETAVTIKPDSHFGREAWQAAIIKYMIALYEDPNTLLKVDMIGNRVDDEPYSGSPMMRDRFLSRAAPNHLARDYLTGAKSWQESNGVRLRIARVGRTDGDKTVPFDEPTLGIIGMWRLGGGAHPYFAVALGETMLRVNQPYLAWNAFERASRMAEFAWPDPQLQRDFRGHCQQRQALIEKSLPADEVPRLRGAFEKELSFGLAFQKDYETYEAGQIAAGKSIEDPAFYDAFWSTHPPIATPPGSADWFQIDGKGWTANIEWLFTGAFVFVAGGLMWRRGGNS